MQLVVSVFTFLLWKGFKTSGSSLRDSIFRHRRKSSLQKSLREIRPSGLYDEIDTVPNEYDVIRETIYSEIPESEPAVNCRRVQKESTPTLSPRIKVTNEISDKREPEYVVEDQLMTSTVESPYHNTPVPVKISLEDGSNTVLKEEDYLMPIEFSQK